MRKIYALFLMLFTIATASFSQVKESNSNNDVYYESAPPAKISIFTNQEKTKPAVIKDNISSKGARFVWSSCRYSYTGSSTKEKNFRVQVEGIQFKDESPLYNLVFSLHALDNSLSVKANSPILIKFGDDSVITLSSLYDSKDNIGDVHIMTYSSFKTYDIDIFARVDENIIDKFKLGFKKVRFEVDDNIYDIEPRKDNIGQFVYDSYILVKESFNKKRDFKENF